MKANPYTLSQRCRQRLFQWHAEQRHEPLGPANLHLYDRVTEVLRGEPDDTSEAMYIALANEVRGVGVQHPTTVSPPVVDDSNWPRQADVVRGLGTYTTNIARLVSKGELKTNGKKGPDLRIDPASVLEYCDRHRVTWNET